MERLTDRFLEGFQDAELLLGGVDLGGIGSSGLEGPATTPSHLVDVDAPHRIEFPLLYSLLLVDEESDVPLDDIDRRNELHQSVEVPHQLVSDAIERLGGYDTCRIVGAVALVGKLHNLVSQ